MITVTHKQAKLLSASPVLCTVSWNLSGGIYLYFEESASCFISVCCVHCSCSCMASVVTYDGRRREDQGVRV